MAGPEAGLRLALGAEGLVGVPFRLHGRDPATGLDCVGLIGASLAAAGLAAAGPAHRALPTGYALRMRGVERWLGCVGALGFGAAAGDWRAGDVVMFAPGPAQVHFAVVATMGGIVHADAGLRRVVRTPTPAGWAERARWRWRGAAAGGDAPI